MLDKDLTIQRGLSEIGEIIQASQLTITPDSPIIKAFETARLRYDELFDAGKIYSHGFFGIIPKEYIMPKEDYKNLERELIELGSNFHDQLGEILHTSVPWDHDCLCLHFMDPFFEAIQNAIEHGTNFCKKGNVEVNCTIGTEGILAVISQPTQGISREKIEETLICKDTSSLIYSPRKEEIRGIGLKVFCDPEIAQIWFEFPNEQSQKFKVIILQTRKRLHDIDEL